MRFFLFCFYFAFLVVVEIEARTSYMLGKSWSHSPTRHLSFYFFYYVYECFACIYVSVPHLCLLTLESERVLEPLELN